MAKAILIMDMPEYCNDCYAVHMSRNGKFCRAAKEHLQPKAERPDWCPLQELPEKKDTRTTLECHSNGKWTEGMKAGWNACLDKILK